ncbi:MAG: hypothetical protein L0Z47_04745 [Actinobacteria bacterium]|nr:hypothetical protein [Actinomycetota bacterium]MCI0677515.1 hypothetical protein [Actinomycetota bacterium]
MGSLLVHLTHGIEAPSRVALAFLVAPLVEAGVPIYASRLSANARGVSDEDLTGKGPDSPAPPTWWG